MTSAAPAPAGEFEVRLPARPYPGLRPFEKGEWPIFFGRERMTDEIIGKLVEQQFLLVHGDSGCGKSSLLKAGVLARLEQQNARAGLTWRTCVMQPRDAPLQRLAVSLAELDGGEADPQRVTEIRRVLNLGRQAPPLLAQLLRRGPGDHICLLVDQFEELFTFARKHGREEATLFAEVLGGLAEDAVPGFYAALTMRSEFLGVCAQFAGLAEIVNRSQYLLPRMSHADLVRAICEPARLYGGRVSPELAERLLIDAGRGQDQLPLIQHGLMVLFQRKAPSAAPDGDSTVQVSWQLEPADYTENVARLLSRHADDVERAAGAASAGVVEAVFRALGEIGAEGFPVRRPQTVAALAKVSGGDEAAVRSVLDRFRADGTSFLNPYGDRPLSTDDVVDISHEALLRCWRRIADAEDGWLVREFRDGQVWRSLLVQAESFEDDPSRILSPAAAEECRDWLAGHNEAWAARYSGGWERVNRLVQASVEAARQEEEGRRAVAQQRIEAKFQAAEAEYQKQTAKRWRQAAAALIVVLTAAIGAFAFALLQIKSERRARRDAENQRKLADAAQAQATENDKQKDNLVKLLSKAAARTSLQAPPRPVLAGPVLIVGDGRFTVPSPDRWGLGSHAASIERTLRSVGSVYVSPAGYRCTGFVAGAGFIVVPAYLVREVGTKDKAGRWILNAGMSIDFGDRVERDSPHRFPITGVAWMGDRDEALGVAVMRVAERSLAGDELPPPLALALGLTIPAGQKLYLVGYPGRDAQVDETDPTFVESVFGGVYDVKRVSCGRMLAMSDQQVVHDCFTSGGSGGAPLIDLESSRVVGVHLVNSPGEGRLALNVASSRPFLSALGLTQTSQ